MSLSVWYHPCSMIEPNISFCKLRDRYGVVGVAPDAEVYTIKVFGDSGGFAYGKVLGVKIYDAAPSFFTNPVCE